MIGTLTDAGALVALIDRDDKYHAACMEQAKMLPRPMVTTWPCFTEAMYLLHGAEGHRGQDELWYYADSGALVIRDVQPQERARMRALMQKYRDTPMDLADASLVVAAETEGVRRVFTVDSDFYVYRTSDKKAFEVVP